MNKKVISFIVFTMFLSFLSNVSLADHGRDFLLVQTARLGNTGDIFIIARQDYAREKNNNFAFEPLLSWTTFDWLSLEVNAHAEKKQGESFNYESSVPGIRVRLTPKENALTMGIAARYEIVSDDHHKTNALKLSGLGTYQIDHWLFGFNLSYAKPKRGNREMTYAVGVKGELRHHLSLGLEVPVVLKKTKVEKS